MKKISLTQGKTALVDDGDFGELSKFKWCAHKVPHSRTWYAVRRTSRPGSRIVKMHRVITGAADGTDVDHVNGQGLDNRRDNLRQVTKFQNMHNQTRKMVGCTSRFRGVSWDRQRCKWQAYIHNGNKRKFLGRFACEEEAARAYDQAGFERDPAHFTPNFK
jgi:AP2 domain/HNH endonuclease